MRYLLSLSCIALTSCASFDASCLRTEQRLLEEPIIHFQPAPAMRRIGGSMMRSSVRIQTHESVCIERNK